MKKFLVLIILGYSTLFAQSMDLSLEEAVSLGKANNLNLKMKDITVEQARREKADRWNVLVPDMSVSATLARSNVAPTISGSVVEGIVPNGGIPGAYDTVYINNYSIEADPWTLIGNVQAQLVLTPAMVNGIKALDLTYRTEQLNREMSETELTRNIQKNYYLLIQLRKAIELLEKNRATTEQQYSDMQAMYRNGMITELDLLQVQSGLASLGPMITTQKNNYEQMRMAYCMDLGLPLDQELNLVDDIKVTELADIDADSLVNRYLADNLSVKSMILGKDSAANGKEATVNQSLPSLILGINYSPMVMDPFNGDSWDENTFDKNDSGRFSVTLSIPIDDWIPHSGPNNKVKEMDDTLKNLEYQQTLLLQGTEMQIRQYAMGLVASAQNLKVLESNVTLAQRAYDMSWEAYRNGQKTATDLSKAQDELLDAENKLIGEKYKYMSTLLDLEYVVNRDL
jgi:outer membrane protein TolC